MRLLTGQNLDQTLWMRCPWKPIAKLTVRRKSRTIASDQSCLKLSWGLHLIPRATPLTPAYNMPKLWDSSDEVGFPCQKFRTEQDQVGLKSLQTSDVSSMFLVPGIRKDYWVLGNTRVMPPVSDDTGLSRDLHITFKDRPQQVLERGVLKRLGAPYWSEPKFLSSGPGAKSGASALPGSTILVILPIQVIAGVINRSSHPDRACSEWRIAIQRDRLSRLWSSQQFNASVPAWLPTASWQFFILDEFNFVFPKTHLWGLICCKFFR